MYRIYTEDKNREQLLAVLDSRFQGYTVTPAIGRWEGVSEYSLVIDLVGVSASDVLVTAQTIRTLNDQVSVLVVHLEASGTRIYKDREETIE